MSKAIETLSGSDATAFRQALKPHLNAVLTEDGFTRQALDDAVAAAGGIASSAAQEVVETVPALVQPIADRALAAAGFPTLVEANTFAPNMTAGQPTTVSTMDTGTHAAVAGEVRLDGTAATVDEQIPNAGVYEKQAGGALLRIGSTVDQRAAVQAVRAEVAATQASSKVSNDALQPGLRPLETIDGIYQACGFRRLLSTYSGPLVRIRKTVSGVSTEQDFFPSAGSDLIDVAAITTWLAGATPYLKTWYDQRGGNHWTQTAAASQPSITISGTDLYITQASGLKALGTGALLNFARYRDAVAAAIVARVNVAPGQTRSVFTFSKGTATNQARLGLLVTTGRALRLGCAPYDDLTGSYTTADSASVNGNWFRAVARPNFRKATLDLMVNGKSTPTATMMAGKSDDTASLGAAINGNTGPDSGNTQDVAAMVLFTRALTSSEASTLDAILEPLVPGYVQPPRPSTAHLFGDSQISNAEEPFQADPTMRSQAQLSALYEASGVYRLVRNKGTGGQTSAQIRTRLLATAIGATEPVIIQAGVNDDLRNSTANHDAALQNLQDMAAYVTSGRYLICTIPYNRVEQSGTPTRANTATFNARLRAAFPDNYIEIAEVLATAPVSAAPGAPANTDGATPAWLMVDNFHRNPSGVALEVAAYKAALDARGW